MQSHPIIDSCWHRLSLDVDLALKPQFQTWAESAPSTELNFGTIDWFPPEEVFDTEWLKNLDQQWDIRFYRVLLFVRENDSDPGCHVDHGQYSSAINWCLGPDLREMLWYSVNPGQPRQQPWWRFDQVTAIDRCAVGNGAVLVRTDQPHSISPGTDRRVCVSARLDPPRISWADTVTKFQDLILPVSI